MSTESIFVALRVLHVLGGALWVGGTVVVAAFVEPLAWLRSGPGLTYTVGAIAAIATVVLGSVVNIPTARRLGAHASTIDCQALAYVPAAFMRSVSRARPNSLC